MNKIILTLFLMFSLVVLSQNKQPKVGLVLSGGGAKGFAHVGVLKELEKAGVQIDYIAGTSMGAIIGGLYAAGYSATQIEKIVTETDFFTLLQDIYPRRSKPFFEKEHGEKHTVILPVNKGKIGLPKGVSRGQNVLGFLNYLLSPVDSITDFSKLPIPFFCIATDVETGLEVKLSSGSLPLSLRASGSFPTLLDPVEINQKLLIDGGVANNFPVEEMKKTGVDIIIGVDVQSKLFDKENIKSAIDVLNQISSFQMYKNNSEKRKLTDVYIHPDIYEYSVVSFEKSKEILEKGKAKAKEFSKVFDSIAGLQTQKVTRLKIENLNAKFQINQIELNGIKDYTRAYVLGKLKISVGDSITNKELNLKLGYLLATGNFQNVEYRLKNSGTSKKLTIQIKESNQKANIRLGVHYDFVYKSGVLINYNQKNLFSKNDALSFDLVVGDKPRVDIQYFVDNGFYYSYGFSTRYNSFKTDTRYNSLGINKINLQYTDFTTRAYIQTTFDRKFAFGIGLEHQNITAKTETISTPTDEPFIFDNSNYFNAYSYLKLDTFDDASFPTKGVLLDAKFKWYLWSSDFNKDFVQFSQIKGKFGFAKTFFNNITFLYTSEAGFTLGHVESLALDFSLGGYNKNFINNFVPFYGYEMNALAEQSFLKSEFEFRFGLPKEQYIHVIANYARVEHSVLNADELFDNTKSGYALGYSINTIIGPLSIKKSWSPDTNNSFWYFNLGFWF